MSTATGRESDKFMLRLPDGVRDTLKAEATQSNRSLNAEIVHRLGLSLAEDDLIIREGDDISSLQPKEQAARLAATFARHLLKGARDRDFASPDKLKTFIADMMFEYDLPLEDPSDEGSVLLNLNPSFVARLETEAKRSHRNLNDEILARLDDSFDPLISDARASGDFMGALSTVVEKAVKNVLLANKPIADSTQLPLHLDDDESTETRTGGGGNLRNPVTGERMILHKPKKPDIPY